LADGVVEDIISALARIRWLFVIARNSSFVYKGRAVDVKQVGRDLGVRYVVEGSVRKAANRVRITGQLIDASSATHLWADRFDGNLDDIFDLQDRISASVVGAIGPRLEQAEIERSKRKPTGSLDAYDFYLRGIANVHQWARQSHDDALALFYKAMELDPEFASAHAAAAYCYVLRKLNGWMIDRRKEIDEAVRLARRAVEFGKDDAVALARGGHALGFLAGDLDSAANFLDRALRLDPNLATAWFLCGWVRIFLGEPDTAIEHFELAMRLSPLDPTLCSMQTSRRRLPVGGEIVPGATQLSSGDLRHGGEPRPRRTARTGAACVGALASDRPRTSHLQSWGLVSASPATRSGDASTGVAKSRTAGLVQRALPWRVSVPTASICANLRRPYR
jgi:TolB-like protein